MNPELNPLFVEGLQLSEGLNPTPSAIERVAKATSREAATWAFTQWELRRRGAVKFARASQMLFTTDGLAMASSEAVARFHAGLFPEGVEVADLTCGIGADLIALAERGMVVGLDQNPDHANAALWNLRAHDLGGLVYVADSVAWATHEKPKYVFVDPARRKGSQRTLNPESFSPSLGALRPILERANRWVMKLSPMLPDDLLTSFDADLIFVSHEGECKEALLVGPSGNQITKAVQIESGEEIVGENPAARSEEPRAYLWELDPAAVRAHAQGAFGVAQLADAIGYLTSDFPPDSPWVTGYRVLWYGAFREKSIASELKSRSWKPTSVKTKYVEVNPEKTLKALRQSSGSPVQVVVYPEGKALRALIVERLLPA